MKQIDLLNDNIYMISLSRLESLIEQLKKFMFLLMNKLKEKANMDRLQQQHKQSSDQNRVKETNMEKTASSAEGKIDSYDPSLYHPDEKASGETVSFPREGNHGMLAPYGRICVYMYVRWYYVC